MAGPDIKAIDGLPGSILGAETPAPGPDTKNLDALLASLNGSAERFQTLWFSFLGLTLYLAIAALATTHRDLLLREPQVLPLVNVKVQLLPFYIIAPLLYLIFHFYVLLILLLLARTAAEFEGELRTTLKDGAAQERYRDRVENALFLQLLVGMKEERVGLDSFLLGGIALLTLMLAPISTLILMQMMFLPYHSLPITWWHRVLVVADAGMTLFLWYRLVYLNEAAGPPSLFRDRSQPLITSALGGSLAVVAFAFWLSFWEGRWVGEPWIGRRDLASTAKGVAFGLFPDRLILPNETIVGDELLEKTKKEISSRGGDFVPTIKLDERDLQAADLSGADLRGVSLSEVAMQGADLRLAQLEGANLSSAHLQGADLVRVQLQGTILANATLQGANLFFALLPGADLSRAQLAGTNLVLALLQGADLSHADLRGADLRAAQLQGADLRDAQLQGADFSHDAQLQGTELSGANASDANLEGSFVYRAEIAEATRTGAFARGVSTDRVYFDGASGKLKELTQAEVDKGIAAATDLAPTKDKAGVVARFDRLKPDFQTAEQDHGDQKAWKDSEQLDRSRDPPARTIAGGLRQSSVISLAAPTLHLTSRGVLSGVISY